MHRQIITLLLLLGAFYILLSPVVATSLYKGMLFHPLKFPQGQYDLETINGIKRTEHFFATTDGLKLHGWFFRNPQAKKVVLVSHGNGGNLTSRLMLAKILLDSGASVFIYDYRGYGKSEGETSLRGVCDDARAAYNFLLHDLKVKPSQLVLYGESLGVALTCQIMPAQCAGIILQSGFSSLMQVSREQLFYMYLYPSWLYPQPLLDNVQSLTQGHPPLLVLHGEKDTLLPISHAEELYGKASQPKTLVRLPQADHNDVIDRPEFAPAILHFLTTLPSD